MAFRGFKQSVLWAGVSYAGLAGAAMAQESPLASTATNDPDTVLVGEIIVTAQKRSQSINSVPMSITAVTGATIRQRDIVTTADLAKLTPGFNSTVAVSGPVYFIRGVGLYDVGIASSPAVSLYLDQAPLFSSIMAQVAPRDIERIEVLKGPQGTLFGANSTGGAVNYIAAKPTTSLQAGADISYRRYDQVDGSAFISGPLTDTLSARLSGAIVRGGAYQYSLTRPGDRLGATRTEQARLLLDWRASDRLKLELNINGFRDRSDTLAAQLLAIAPTYPDRARPEFLQSPIAPDDNRAADWAVGHDLRKNDNFIQTILRADYELAPDIVLTSLSNYGYVRQNKFVDLAGVAESALIGGDAVTNADLNVRFKGSLRAFSQEIRVAGKSEALDWTIGANYDHQNITDRQLYTTNQTVNQALPPLPAFHYPAAVTLSTIDNYALFANLDYKVTDAITIHGGIRGTKSVRDADSCTYDWNPDGDGAALPNTITVLQQIFASIGVKTTPVVAIAPTGCIQLTPAPDLSPGATRNGLNEKNVSFRVGLDYTFTDGALIYANVSQGYKSGIITPIPASASLSFSPAKQEKLLAYEAGFKAPFFDRKVRANGAIFYYDYSDKQLLGNFEDPTFGLLAILINIPRSRVFGLEGNIDAEPIKGLNISVGGTYLDSKVTSNYINFNSLGGFGNYRGSRIPYTPRFQAVADGQYQWRLNGKLNAMIGASITHHSGSNATFSTASVPAPLGELNAYTLLDLRAAISSSDDRWRVSVFGKNVTNEFYATTVTRYADVFTRLAGSPSVYGVTLSYLWK